MTVTVLFCMHLTKKATVSVTVDDDLSIVNNSLPESGVLTVIRGSSASFNLKLRPRAIGQLTVTVSVMGDHGERDTIRKLLNVKVLIYFQPSVKKNGNELQILLHVHDVPAVIHLYNIFPH